MSDDRLNDKWVRMGHGATSLIAAALVGLLLLFFFVSTSLQSSSDRVRQIISWSTLALPWLMLLAAIWAIWRRISFRVLLGLIIGSGAVLGYLSWDDAVRPSRPKIDRLVPDNSPSYAAYRWFLKDDKESRVTAEYAKRPDLPHFPASSIEWAAFVSAHRGEFEKAWTGDVLGREWVAAMALHSPEGLYPPPAVKGPYLNFACVRRSCVARWGVAHLTQLDGKPDDSVSLLLPLVRAMYHLQEGGTTLVTQMITIVCLKGTYARLDLVLNDPKLSDKKRREIVEVLQQSPAVAASIRNAYLGERVIAHASMDEIADRQSTVMEILKYLPILTDDGLPKGISLVAPMLLNRNRAEREYMDFLDRVSAMSRVFIEDKNAVQKFHAELERWRFKNPAGGLFAALSYQAFSKIAPNWWQLEDQRTALLERLKV